ncbi:hypothetical protein BDR26DRAFT_920653 [Obelidium mucronatum]|nr:hypothetical protein BDR26DRAFT_920653 [Obelidium mucronatum]
MTTPPPFFWVKFGGSRPAEVSTEGCRNIDGFIDRVKAKMSPKLDGYSAVDINIYTKDPAKYQPLRPGLALTDLASQTGFVQNDDEHPLIVAVATQDLNERSVTFEAAVLAKLAKLEQIHLSTAPLVEDFLPAAFVIGGHLFKECWKESCFDRLGFHKIDDPRNGLLLFKPFEYAFDNSQICFEYSAEQRIFTMRILDSSLRELTLREYIQREKEIEQNVLQKRESWLSKFEMNPSYSQDRVSELMGYVDGLLVLLEQPFSAFEGRGFMELQRKCYSRCLSFQAMMAKRLAVEEGWISLEEAAESSESMWSDLENKKRDQILAWVQTLDSVAQGRIDISDD